MNEFDKQIILELFDRSYPIINLIGVGIGGKEIKFKNINQIFSYHLKNKEKTPIFYIKGYFLNRLKNNIEFIIHPTTINGNIFDENTNEIFTVIFRPMEEKFKLKTNSFDATIVTATVIKIVLDFLNALKKVIQITTDDWNSRTNNGILRFDPYPNMTMNPVSKQDRYSKEKEIGITQRGNMYQTAFKKIIKPH